MRNNSREQQKLDLKLKMIKKKYLFREKNSKYTKGLVENAAKI